MTHGESSRPRIRPVCSLGHFLLCSPKKKNKQPIQLRNNTWHPISNKKAPTLTLNILPIYPPKRREKKYPVQRFPPYHYYYYKSLLRKKKNIYINIFLPVTPSKISKLIVTILNRWESLRTFVILIWQQI